MILLSLHYFLFGVGRQFCLSFTSSCRKPDVKLQFHCTFSFQHFNNLIAFAPQQKTSPDIKSFKWTRSRQHLSRVSWTWLMFSYHITPVMSWKPHFQWKPFTEEVVEPWVTMRSRYCLTMIKNVRISLMKRSHYWTHKHSPEASQQGSYISRFS